MESNAKGPPLRTNISESSDLQLKEIYRIAYKFYREQAGKVTPITYDDNIKMLAFAKQASCGSFVPENDFQLGALDVIGRDRMKAWQLLGDMSQKQAMREFVQLLLSICPAFEPFLEAVKRNKLERLITPPEPVATISESENFEANAQHNAELQKRKFQDILNQETFYQFKEYAESQYPRNPEKQSVLIRQLQYEHFHQYMRQICAKLSDSNDLECEQVGCNIPKNTNMHKLEEYVNEVSNTIDSCPDASLDKNHLILPAKMWTRPDVNVFKSQVAQSTGHGILSIEHGEIVTVRVPTHENGNSLLWEFSTDDYDVGFGLLFEWCEPSTNEVTVHISDSEENEDMYDDLLEGNDLLESENFEAAAYCSTSRNPISVIIPVYRRECHKEVYVGSHIYPAPGVYLLKFDNSFSMWRSKTLYYKVYYERSV